MPVGAIVSAATGIAGLASSRRAGRQADRAMDQQAQIAAEQTALGREQLAFGREQYEDWKQTFQPVLDQLRIEAFENVRPDFDAIAADVGGAFDTSREINTRNRQRMGLRPSDGGFAADERRYALGRARATVGARNQARDNARDQRYNRLLGLGNLAVGQQGNVSNMVSQGYGATQGALRSAGATAGQQAGVYGNLAAEGARAFTGTDWAGVWNDVFGGGGGGGGGGGSQPGPWADGYVFPGGGDG